MAALSSVLVTTNKNKRRTTGREVFLSNGCKVTNTTRSSASLCFLLQSWLELLLCAKSLHTF